MDDDHSLRWTHLTPDDVEAWAELTRALSDADGTGEFYEAADLAEELEEHGFTPESDTWAVWQDDRLVAYGQLRVSLTLDREGLVRAAPAHPARVCGGPLLQRPRPSGSRRAAAGGPDRGHGAGQPER